MNSKTNSSKRSRRRRIPRSEVYKIYRMYESGITVDAIQTLTSRARSTIYRVISLERKRRALLDAPIVVPKEEAKQPEPQAPIFSEAVPEHEHVFVPTFLQRVAIWFAMRVGVLGRVILSAMSNAFGPETRTMATPAGPRAVAIAAIVSSSKEAGA